jgi:Lon protease-like protein
MFRASSFVIDSDFVIRISFIIRHLAFVIWQCQILLFPRCVYVLVVHCHPMPSSVTLPKQLPVMPLPGAVLFPHALLPLYIVEPRYREMLKHALQRHRMFCVTLIKPSCPEWHAPEDFFHLATVGLIRACVGRGDGTSNLILQGLQRVRFASFQQETPFPIARIHLVESRNATTVETEALGAKVLELYANLKHERRQLPAKVDRYLSELRDLEMLADLMASTFVNDPLRRQRVLEERSLNQRLRFLITYLRDEIGNAAA